MSKETKLDRIYAEFDKEYSDKSQEEMSKIISDLEKEVAGKENALEGLEGEKQEKLQKDIEQGKKRLENLRGYSKNKGQIEGIKKYRDTLVQKLEKETANRDESKRLFEKAIKYKKEIDKKLADEKYTMTLDQYEYNELCENQERLSKVMEEQAKEYKRSSDRIVELQGKISKCNLAWKTLFVNKDWDEIHRRALSDNTRLTRKVDEKNIPLSPKKRDKQSLVSKEKVTVQQKVGDTVKRIMDKKEEDNKGSDKKDTKALVESKDGFFRRMWRKLVNWVNGKEESTKSEDIKSSEKESGTEKTDLEEGKVNTETVRDTFLEGLRQHVDKEYRDIARKEGEARIEEDLKKRYAKYLEEHKEHKEEEESR